MTTGGGRRGAASQGDVFEREVWLSWPSVAVEREPPVVPRAVLTAAIVLGCVIVTSALLVLAGTVGLPPAAGQTARVSTVPTPVAPPGAALLWVPPAPTPVAYGR